jgi:hypothetical protein
VLLGAVRSHVPAQQAAKQSFMYKFIDGEMQAGRNSICFLYMFDRSALMTPQKATLEVDCLRDSYPKFQHSLSLYVSISVPICYLENCDERQVMLCSSKVHR